MQPHLALLSISHLYFLCYSAPLHSYVIENADHIPPVSHNTPCIKQGSEVTAHAEYGIVHSLGKN